MVQTTLLIGVALALATAILFAVIGDVLRRRPVSDESRLAMYAFTTWWWGAASVIVLDALHSALGMLGVTSDGPHLVLAFLLPIALSLTLWGLLYYLAYLMTGRREAWLPLAFFQLGMFVYMVYYYVELSPWVLVPTPWEIRYIGEGTPIIGVSVVFGLLIATPVVLASLAYGRLYFTMREPTLRYRIALVSIAFTGWFSVILYGFLMGWEAEPWFPLMYRIPGIFAAVIILAAYRPPEWIERRLVAKA